VNLYVLRSAKHIAVKEASSEGQEYIVPSLIASHIWLLGLSYRTGVEALHSVDSRYAPAGSI